MIRQSGYARIAPRHRAAKSAAQAAGIDRMRLIGRGRANGLKYAARQAERRAVSETIVERSRGAMKTASEQHIGQYREHCKCAGGIEAETVRQPSHGRF